MFAFAVLALNPVNFNIKENENPPAHLSPVHNDNATQKEIHPQRNIYSTYEQHMSEGS